MRRIALAVLMHDRLRALLAVLGVAAAMALLILQWGLHAGFRAAASDLIVRLNQAEDTWGLARGARTLEDGDLLPLETLPRLRAMTCVTSVRPLLIDFHQRREADGHLQTVLLLATDADGAAALGATLPREGELVRDASDASTASSLELRGGAVVTVVGSMQGVRSPSQAPYLLTTLSTARALLGLPEDTAHFVTVRADDTCLQSLRADPVLADLEWVDSTYFSARAQEQWIDRTGLGRVLGFGLLLATAMAAAVLGQVLLAHVRSHRSELAALRAAGATRWELMGFVGWQAAWLLGVGALLGAGMALALAPRSTLPILVDASTLVRSCAVLLAATSTALAGAAWYVRSIKPEEILR